MRTSNPNPISRLLAVVLVGIAVTPVLAADGIGMPPGRWWERPRVAEALGLTAEQRQRLDTIALDHLRSMIDLKAAVERNELELRAASETEPFEPSRARQVFSALQQARHKLESERFETLLKTREILTAEQWRTLRTLVIDRRQQMREGPAGEDDAPRPPLPRQPRRF